MHWSSKCYRVLVVIWIQYRPLYFVSKQSRFSDRPTKFCHYEWVLSDRINTDALLYLRLRKSLLIINDILNCFFFREDYVQTSVYFCPKWWPVYCRESRWRWNVVLLWELRQHLYKRRMQGGCLKIELSSDNNLPNFNRF